MLEIKDLKVDVELTQLVRRQKRRLDAEQEQRQLSQALEEDDFLEGDDEEEVHVEHHVPGRRRSIKNENN